MEIFIHSALYLNNSLHSTKLNKRDTPDTWSSARPLRGSHVHLGRGPQPARGSSSWTPVILTAPAARPQLPQRHPHDGRSHEEAAAQRHSDKRTNRWASLAAFTTCPGSAGAERRGPGLGQGHCHPDPEAGTAPGRGLRKARGAIFQNCDPGRLHRGAEPRSRLSRPQMLRGL